MSEESKVITNPMDKKAFRDTTIEEYMEYTVAELRMERMIISKLILKPMRENDEWREDPRRPAAETYYKEQLRRLNQALYAKLWGEDGPPAQGIKMKPLTMTGKAPGRKRG